jgi:hypothetical protein
MTDYEIKKKIENIKTSQASLELREKAIKELESKLSTSSSLHIAKQQCAESAPDYSDIIE